jgi:sirohydrochlorin ferrochelatase
MAGPPLIAVAHGSRDPRSAATVHELLGVVRSLAPDVDVRAAFLDLSAPRLPEVLAAVGSEAIVVPLLLGSAYHARVDIPGAVAKAAARQPRLRVRVADVLGPDARLERAAFDRLLAAGADPDDPELGVVLTGAGSSHEPANAAVRRVAAGWAHRTRWSLTAAFAAATTPDVPAAIARLRAGGARRIAVGSWFLAPGLLPDRVASQALATDPDTLVAAPLGAQLQVADVILSRYAAAQIGSARRAS